MPMHSVARTTFACATIALLASTVACTHALAEPHARFGLGRAADPAVINRLDIDVAPNGTGLPDGHGDAVDGASVFAASCQSCHGNAIRLDPKRWPYATTLFDFVRRAMPPNRTTQLRADDLYAITAYELYMNGLLTQHERVDRTALPHVRMPNVDDFIEYP